MVRCRFERFAICAWMFTIAFTASVRAADTPAKQPTFADIVHQQSLDILNRLESTNDTATAQTAAGKLLDQVAAYAPDDKLDAFRDASFTYRLATQLAKLSADERIDTLKFFRENTEVANAMVFLLRADQRDVAGAYKLLARLRTTHAAQLNKFANLTAALCVVRSSKLIDHVNENQVEAADPIAVFDFYVRNEGNMFFGLKNVPGELLEYVVDVTASIDELNWALSHYAGNRNVGERFFDIDYDYDAFRDGTPKLVTVKGFSLQNILKYGGVCADQAYFAVTIGKAIGVPTAMTIGASAESGHAWVGFLQANGKTGSWNFNSGRYEAYQGVQGSCRDPQSHKEIPDSYISLLGELITTKTVDRQNCIALTDAAARLRLALKNGAAMDIAAPTHCAAASLRATPRKVDTAAVLALTELALRQSAGYPQAWFGVRDMAVDKQLTLAEKQRWSDVLLRLGAEKYPEFTLAILSPMVKTIEEIKEQDAMWRALLPIFKTHFDLSASILMSEAAMWEANQQPDKAGMCYMQVVNSYANAGPFVLAALDGAEKLLISTNRSNKVITLYEQTWKQIHPPQDMAQQFARQSCWYRVGKLYAEKLQAAGDRVKADAVLARVDRFGSTSAGPAKK